MPARPAAAAAAVLAAAVLRGSPGLPLTARWAAHPVWDDGQAEVARYRAARIIYGEERRHEAVLITVKEDLDADTLVKADPPHEGRSLLTVLKLNLVREIPTPHYDYRFLTSVFVERTDPGRLVKLTSGSQEWCGNTFKAVRVRNGRTGYDWTSYFDGEADGRQELDLRRGDLAEDQIPLAFRGLEFRHGLSFETRVLPSFATNRGGPLEWRTARFRVLGPEPIDVPAGRYLAWRVDADLGDRRVTWWFDAASLHGLLAMKSSAGERLELLSIDRRAYWKLAQR